MEKSKEDFAVFYRAHAPLVRAVIFQIAGQEYLKDLTQEAFVRIWQARDTFRGAAQLQSWVYRVATNVALDHLRRWKRERNVSEVDLSHAVAVETSVENRLIQRQIVAAGLRGLSPEHRAVVVLALIHELSLREISEILELPEGTVKSRLHYGKEYFRQLWAKEGERKWALI